MKREIKFRAYIGNKFIYSNDLQEFAKIKQFKNEGLRMVVNRPKLSSDCIGGGNNISNHGQYYSEWYDLQQYTGMKDKTGILIYEGDIYTDSENTFEVRFGEYVYDGYDFFGLYTYSKQLNSCAPLCKQDEPVIEVIGNIYENANILTQ